jgi:hypothetical protein
MSPITLRPARAQDGRALKRKSLDRHLGRENRTHPGGSWPSPIQIGNAASCHAAASVRSWPTG